MRETTPTQPQGFISIRDATAFVQEWLWFGLLSEFLERDINLTQFVCHDKARRPVLSTTHLPTSLPSGAGRLIG